MDAYSPSMTLDDVPALIEALEVALLPASEDAVRKCCAMIVGSFPQAQPGAPEIYTGGMLQEMAEFPADILEATVREVRRTLKFLPSISEVYAIANDLRRERRRLLRSVNLKVAEHAQTIEAIRLAGRRAEERQEHARRQAAKAVGAFIRSLGAQQECEEWVLMMTELRLTATEDEVIDFVVAFFEGEPETLEHGRLLREAARKRRAQEAPTT